MRLFTNHEKNNMKISLIIFLHLVPHKLQHAFSLTIKD